MISHAYVPVAVVPSGLTDLKSPPSQNPEQKPRGGCTASKIGGNVGPHRKLAYVTLTASAFDFKRHMFYVNCD